MVNRTWSFISGLFLTGGAVFIGLILNFIISGDPLALVDTTNSVLDGTTILFTTLFIAISGGHYIGGSFNEEDDSRWIALGANTVLWLVVIGFITIRYLEGGTILEPILFGAALILVGGGFFALHKAGHIEDESQFDRMIDSLSSQGTGLIVTASFIARTVPDPIVGGAISIGVISVGLLLWYYTGDELMSRLDAMFEVLIGMSSADEVKEVEETSGDNPD